MRALNTHVEDPWRGVWLPGVLCLLLVSIFSFQLWLHAVSTSATTDESLHLLAGHRYLQCGDFAFNPEHPPLLKVLAAAPLAGMDVSMPDGMRCNPGFIAKAEAFRLGAVFRDDNGEDRILIPARMMAALISVVLALLVWLASWRMFGPWTATAVMALFAMEPVLVAHGALVTTDMAITMTAFLATMVIYASREWRMWRRVSAMGLAFGLMLASKHSAVLMLPLLALLRLFDASMFREGRWRAGSHLFRPLLELCLAGVIALTLLWAFYGFRYSATPGADGTVELHEFLRSVGRPGVSQSSLGSVFLAIASTHVFPEAYLMGLADIVGSGVRNTRIFGRMYSEGQWFFFPIAFSVKSSIPLLLLLPVGLVALWMDRSRRRQWLFLVFPPAAYLAIAMSSTLTTGIRHILQIYPYLILLAGFGLSVLWRRSRICMVALACLLTYQVAVVARTAPDYIPFANAFWGGPAGAYDVMTFDSVEWGQSMKRIRAHVAAKQIKHCWVAGVGDPFSHVDTTPCKRLPEGRLWRGRFGGVEPVPRRLTGTLFLSARVSVEREGNTFRPALSGHPPLLNGAVFVSTGTFDLPGVAALAHAMRADDLIALRQPEAAIREGAAAVALAADDPRTWISYGDALQAGGRTQEARHALATAGQALARTPALDFFASGRLDESRQRLGQRQ